MTYQPSLSTTLWDRDNKTPRINIAKIQGPNRVDRKEGGMTISSSLPVYLSMILILSLNELEIWSYLSFCYTISWAALSFLNMAEAIMYLLRVLLLLLSHWKCETPHFLNLSEMMLRDSDARLLMMLFWDSCAGNTIAMLWRGQRKLGRSVLGGVHGPAG